MNCFNHSETPAVAYCRACGKALCTECKRTAQGTIFCDEHAPAAAIEGAIRQAVVDRMAQETAAAAGPPPPAGSIATGDVSPGLACLLGFIPGVGSWFSARASSIWRCPVISVFVPNQRTTLPVASRT